MAKLTAQEMFKVCKTGDTLVLIVSTNYGIPQAESKVIHQQPVPHSVLENKNKANEITMGHDINFQQESTQSRETDNDKVNDYMYLLFFCLSKFDFYYTQKTISNRQCPPPRKLYLVA